MKGMFYNDGTNSASATIPGGNGQVACLRLGYTSPGAGTLKVYRPNDATYANAAVSNSTALTIRTDANGYVGGRVLTTSDVVLVCNSGSTGNAWYLSTISAVAAVSSSTVALTLGSAIYCAAGDKVCVCRAADIVTMVTAAETVADLYDGFYGFPASPVHLVLAATGTCRINGSYEYQE